MVKVDYNTEPVIQYHYEHEWRIESKIAIQYCYLLYSDTKP
jgi:hypothetical protein